MPGCGSGQSGEFIVANGICLLRTDEDIIAIIETYLYAPDTDGVSFVHRAVVVPVFPYGTADLIGLKSRANGSRIGREQTGKCRWRVCLVIG